MRVLAMLWRRRSVRWCSSAPVMSNGRASDVREALAEALGVPVLCMESPRGLNDPALGALADVVSRADLIVLLGKEPDFTLRFGQPPAIDPACRVVVIDPDADALERALDVIGSERVALSGDRRQHRRCAAPHRARERPSPRTRTRLDARKSTPRCAFVRRSGPAVDSGAGSRAPGRSRPRGAAPDRRVARRAVFVSDGGEFGQWAQACVNAPTRLINGQGGSIGSAIPFALAAKIARPERDRRRA